MKIVEIPIRSHSRCEMIDISSKIELVLRENPMTDGILTLFTPHTTAAITINENADPDVTIDMLYGLSKLAGIDPKFRHAEGNSDAHIKSSLVGVSETLLVQDNRLLLGTWQGIYFCEFDGPRTRRIIIKLSSC